MSGPGFYLGTRSAGERVLVDPADLTTHGVVVGMTGSGKTGLLVGLVEECLLAGIPALVVDPKGDLANLFLTFPELRAQDFAPWIDPDEARRSGMSSEAFAAQAANRWQEGILSSGIELESLRRLQDGTAWRLFTPGGGAGERVNVLSGLAPPSMDWEHDAEGLRDHIAVTVSALLERAGEDADSLQSPAHVFLSNLLEDRWRAGEFPDLAAVLGYLVHPPFEKLGVLHVDAFYPADRRRETVQKLNALLASPAFRSWQEGGPLSVASWLSAASGKTPLCHFYTAHLDDRDRLLFTALLLGEIVSWMRRQPGTGSLRLLVVMDEVWGLLPPDPHNPPTKRPLLTLLKQARAFGVGVVAATQNPVDLDYKALTNAGLWCVGRLSTEQDKARLLDGLDAVSGGADRSHADEAISGLKPRQFLLRNVHDPQAQGVFTTRWARAYLRGPMTATEVRALASALPVPPPSEARAETVARPRPVSGKPAVRLPAGLSVRYLDPSALRPDRPGGAVAAAAAGPPRRYRPALAARAAVRFDDARTSLDHSRIEWRLLFPLAPSEGWTWPVADAPDLTDVLRDAPIEGVSFDAVPPALESRPSIDALSRDLKRLLVEHETLERYRAPALGLVSNVGEGREAFAERVARHVDDRIDEEVSKLRVRFLEKKRRLDERVQGETADVERARSEVQARGQEGMIELGESLIGVFLGGRRSTRILSQARRRERMKRTAEGRLEKESLSLERARTDLEALEAELAKEMDRIESEIRGPASVIDTLAVRPESTDVRIEEIVLVWVPDAAV